MSETEVPKEKQETIGDAAVAAIRAGSDNQEALEAVKAKFPDAKTSLSSINWYRNKLRNDKDPDVLSARELKKKRAATAAATAEAATTAADAGGVDPLE